jgi:V/A-type H+-transporting ATPase subunit B
MRKYFDAIRWIAGNVVKVDAGGVGYDELATISMSRGDSLAQVIHLEGSQVSLQVFAGSQGVSNNDRVRFLHRPMQVPFTEDLFGRALDGSGRPRDGRPPVGGKMIDIGSAVVNPVRRRMPDRMIETRIPMIDIFNSLVESQKLPIFSVAGEPYNELLARVGLQADADVIILGGMGIRYDDYLLFRQAF